jgi:hypothetical protein
MDILAANEMCFALYADVLTPEALPVNLARFIFFDPRAPEFFVDWACVARDVVGTLRTESGRAPFDRCLSDLVGELVTRSEEFRTGWARHDVRLHRTSLKRLHNPVVGDIELTGDVLELPGDGLTLVTYTAPAGSAAQQQLDFLASWHTGRAPVDHAGPTSRYRARASSPTADGATTNRDTLASASQSTVARSPAPGTTSLGSTWTGAMPAMTRSTRYTRPATRA